MTNTVDPEMLEPGASRSPVLHSTTELRRTPTNFNPLPHMPILGSSNLAAMKDIMSKIWTYGDTIIWLS